MYTKCEYCGEFAVDDSENIEVCKSCGIVVEETIFSGAEYVPVSRPFVPYSKSEARLHKQKKKSISLQHGQKILDNLCHFNGIPVMYRTEITELFKLVVSVRRFSRKDDAGTAAACCLFLLMRKNKQVIAISTLCKQVPCKKGRFSFYLKFLKSCLSSNEEFKHYSYILNYNASDGQKNYEQHVPDIIPSLINEICAKADPEEKSQLIEKTTALVELAYSCWLFTGRSPSSVVATCAFLCWKSMNRVKNSNSYAKFCERFEIHEPSARYKIPELKAVLLKLGKMIPSRTENYVNEDNLLYHLDTILKHSETLRNDLFPNSYTCTEVDIVEFSNFRIPANNFPRNEPSDAVHYDSDMNASDIEISDSEIQTYLFKGKKKIIEFCKKENLTPIKSEKLNLLF